jgi:hypothetical protein
LGKIGPMAEFESDRKFHVWKYTVSHAMLLIWSVKDDVSGFALIGRVVVGQYPRVPGPSRAGNRHGRAFHAVTGRARAEAPCPVRGYERELASSSWETWRIT